MIFANRAGGGSHEEASRLREDLEGLWKQPVQFRIDRLSQDPECRNGVVVMRREAAADVEELELEPASSLRRRPRGQVQRLDVVLDVRALAADVEAQPSTSSLLLRANAIRSTASPGSAPNLLESSTIDPVFGTRNRSTRPACGACRAILITSS